MKKLLFRGNAIKGTDTLMSHSPATLRTFLVGVIVSLLLLGGCASTGSSPRDPLEPMNRGVYQFNDAVDRMLFKPVAETYREVIPALVRTGVSNFFSNINDVIVALNNLLQGKIGNAASDVGRVSINSTFGLLGVFDVASELGIEKNNEDFGQTLGYWGIGSGPYLVLPFFGPSSFRDTVGRVGDMLVDPTSQVDPSRARNQLRGASVVSRRASLLDASRVLETAALDPYEFVRDAYFQRRRSLIYDGNPPRELEYDNDTAPRSSVPGLQRDVWTNPQPLQPGEMSPKAAVLVSGETPSPARQEALEREARSSARPAAEPVAAASPSMMERVVRMWFSPSPQQ